MSPLSSPRPVIFLALSGAGLLWVYSLINHRAVIDPVSLTMPAWVPFWPVLTLPYLAMLLGPWFLPLTLRDPVRFRHCLRSFFLAFAITLTIWFFHPTELPRPVAPADWWHAPYRSLIFVDAPRNILPCGHIIAPVISLWFLHAEHPRWTGRLAFLFLIGVVSIVTTWQHRPVDVAFGALISLASIWLSRPRRPAPGTASDNGLPDR